MPGIKIHRKSRLKTVNTRVTEEVTKVETPVNDSTLATPENKPEPYLLSGDPNDYVGDYYHESFPEHLKGNQRIFIQIAAYRDNELPRS